MSMKKIIYLSIVFSIVVGFTGCSTAKPYAAHINKKYADVENDLKQSLLGVVIDKRSSGLYQSRNSCVYLKQNVRWNGSTSASDINYNYEVCYKVKDNIIHSYDHSSQNGYNYYSGGKKYAQTGRPSYYATKASTQYVKYLISLEKGILLNDLETELNHYKIFKQEFENHQNQSKLKYKNLSTSFEDTTGILTKDVMNELTKHKRFISTRYTDSLRLYKGINRDPKKRELLNKYLVNAANYRGVKANSNSSSQDKSLMPLNNFRYTDRVLVDAAGRYKVKYAQNEFQENYLDFPKNVIFKITSVKFNFLPTKYIAKDKNIEVEIVNTPFGRHSIKTFKVSNRTKEFIELDTIAGYYGKDVYDGLSAEKIKIAPMSTKVIPILDFPSNKILDLKSKNQINQYGFSVSYRLLSQNITKNLFKVDDYNINELK